MMPDALGSGVIAWPGADSMERNGLSEGVQIQNPFLPKRGFDY